MFRRSLLISLLFLQASAAIAGDAAPPFSATYIAGKEDDCLGPCFVLTIDVTNHDRRDAGVINAELRFHDILGNDLGKLRWLHNRGIRAGKTRRLEQTIDGFIAGPLATLANTDPAYVTAEFHVFKVAWSDGSISEYDKEPAE